MSWVREDGQQVDKTLPRLKHLKKQRLYRPNKGDGEPYANVQASLTRPGGNITGTTSFDVDLSRKRLELLKDSLPHFSRVAVHFKARSTPMRRRAENAKIAAQELGLTLQSVGVQDPNELEAAFAAMTRSAPTPS
jgi:putative tryptophan/tyrosine transport system substrate-binding protein